MKKSLNVSLILAAILMMTATSSLAADLLGAGATFPYPFYAKLFSEYSKKNGVKINYQSIGSGGGIQQLKNKTVDFGASDAFLSNKEMNEMPGKVLHIPTCLGAVTLAYNVPGNPSLKLTGKIIADIFLGKISKWNDAEIAKVNPGAALPDLAITTVHRSDGSGTTSIFTDYLAKVSTDWKNRVGAGKSVNWPMGLGGKGNSGVAGLIKQMPGSIGYVELAYAKKNKMSIASVQNKSGAFITPSIAATSAAAKGSIPDDTRVSITNTEAEDGYPISGFTWILIYQNGETNIKSKAGAIELAKLVSWMTHEGQAYADDLDYAPLPDAAVKKVEKIIQSFKYEGNSVQ